MHARLALRFASAAAAASLLVASGCTSSDNSPRAAETPDSPAVQSPAGGSSSTPEEPSTSAPASSPSDGARPLLDRLLPTGQVPGLNAQWAWQDGDTGQPTTDPFGLCAQTASGADLLSIGATDVVARTYFPPDDSDDNAAEQVAEFPDATTAHRAWAVLAGWHKRCGTAVSAENHLHVGRFAPVAVDEGTARWYLLSWTPPGEETGRFEAFGAVLVGTRIAVLRMDHSGQDHDYPPGQDPMIGMVIGASGWMH